MIYNGHGMTRSLLSESDSRRLARKYNDTGFRSNDLVVLREAFNSLPIDRGLIREYRLDRNEVMALQIISEQTGEDHEVILLEFFGAIKKLGKAVGAAIASPFKAVAKAKKGRDQGASMWQSVKYGMTALPQLFKHGTHFGQGEASEKAKAAYEKILSDFENHSNKYLKDLTAAAKELQKSDFPNNARPEDFRMMLMGKEEFADIESEGLGGLLGAMLEIREAQQEFVNNGGDIKVANQIIDRMRKMLQFYMGELHDTYQSLESKDRYGRPIIRNQNRLGLMDYYFDNNYWYGQVCEGMYNEYGWMPALLIEAEEQEGGSIVEDPEDAEKIKAAVENMDEKQIASALMNDEGLEGLSSEQLNSMRMASSALRPVLIAVLGACMTALGMQMGGSALGDFENSKAFAEMMTKLEGKSVTEIVKEIPEQAAEYFDIVDVKSGEGFTQMIARRAGLPDAEVSKMKMGDFMKLVKDTGVRPENLEGLMNDPQEGFAFMGTANPNATVGQFFKGVVEIQNMEGQGVNEEGHKMIKALFLGEGEPILGSDSLGEKAGKIRNGFLAQVRKLTQKVTKKGAGDVDFGVEFIRKRFPGTIGKGNHPLSLVKGVGPKIQKKAFVAAKKEVIKKVSYSFASGSVGKAIAGAALPTVLATAGVGIATSGIAIAALRKFAKNRKKTIDAAIKLLTDIEGPVIGTPGANPPPDPPFEPPEEEPVGIEDQLPLDLYKRTLEDQGYENADELAAAQFADEKMVAGLVQDTPPKPQSLTAGYRRELKTMTETLNRWSKLAGLNEDIAYDDFTTMTQAIAKNAGLPEPNEKQLGYAAQALNVTRGVGDITEMPGPFAKKEFEDKIDELEEIIANLKLENNEAVRSMLDSLAAKAGLDPKNYKDLDNDEYMAKLGETWNNDQMGWEDAMEEIDALKTQLAAAQKGLDEAEAKIVQQSAELDKLIDENSHLIAKNKRAKDALRRALDLAKRKDVKIGDLKSNLEDAENLNKLKDKEIGELNSELASALEEIKNLKDREDELNSRLIDLRKLYLAISKVGGSNKTTYDTKHPQKKREDNLSKMADAFTSLGDEFPALRDTGKIIRKSMEAGVNTSVKGSGQLKKGGGRNEPEARSKKVQDSRVRRGSLLKENLHKKSMLSLLDSIDRD